MATGMEKKELDGASDIFWSREPIMGHKGTKERPAIVPSFNDSRVVGLETEQACYQAFRQAHRRPLPSSPPRQLSTRVNARSSAQGVIWFKLNKGPLHLVNDQYFKLEQLDGGSH